MEGTVGVGEPGRTVRGSRRVKDMYGQREMDWMASYENAGENLPCRRVRGRLYGNPSYKVDSPLRTYKPGTRIHRGHDGMLPSIRNWGLEAYEEDRSIDLVSGRETSCLCRLARGIRWITSARYGRPCREQRFGKVTRRS